MNKNTIGNRLLILSALILTMFIQNSCIKEYSNFDKMAKNVDYTPSVAGAIAHTKLTVRDIIRDYDDNELFSEDETGFLYLMYHKKVFTKSADQVISLADQAFPTMDQYNKTTYDNAPVVGGYHVFPTVPIHYDFLLNNQEQLDSVRFDAMDINVKVNSSFHLSGMLTLTFPALVKNGQAFTMIVYPDATGNFHYDLDTHIEDYTLVFDLNRVLVNFDLKLQDGTSVSGDQLDITIQMKNMDFQSIFGYVGKIDMNVPQDTIHLNIFDKAFAGDVYFENPSMTMYIDNAFGLPVRTYYDSLHTFSTIGNTWNSYPFPGEDSLDINYPTEYGQIAHQQVVLDVNNFPEIRDVISSHPKYLFFKIEGFVNPDGYNQSTPNFLIDTSKVSVDLEVKLPLWGNALYSLVDTLELNIQENFTDISKHFVEANLRTIFDNFLPTNAYGQVIFVDSLYHPLDTLYKGQDIGERLIESAILDANGRAKQSVKKTTDILFGNGPQYEHDINDLENVRYAIVISTLKTNESGSVGQNSPLVKFYSDNYLEVKFGVKGQGKYEGVIE